MVDDVRIPHRHQRSRLKDARQPESCKYCGRPGKFSNDYEIFDVNTKGHPGFYYISNRKTGYLSNVFGGDQSAHRHAVEMHKIQMESNLKSDPAYYDDLLKYKWLSCFCPLDLPCHVDTIIEHLRKRVTHL